MLENLGLERNSHKLGFVLDLPCAWTLQLFSPGKKPGCDSSWFRNIYVKWYNLIEVAQSVGENRKQMPSGLLIHCNPDR